MQLVTAAEAAEQIQSHNAVFIHSVAAAPQQLIKSMMERAKSLKDVAIYHLHTEGEAPYASPEYAANFHTRALFVGSNIRGAVASGEADYIPAFLSEIPRLFRERLIALDVALIQVSPPDQHGFCSLGVSVDVSLAAVHSAATVIAQINPNMPRTHGDGLIPVSRINFAIECNDSLPEATPVNRSAVESSIGANCAELVEDGATLQMGIGAIPDAVLAALGNHRRIGIHTEMFSDGLIDLIESGVVSGECKRVHPYKIVSTFVMGSRRLYDFIDDNPQIVLLDVGYVNDTSVIRRNPKVTAINSALEVDLTGQVCADSIGTRQYSGVGGQMDFIRGAALSEKGKPIIALPAATRLGESRIVPFLKQGAGVVTTRAHVHYVVTEYGVANLYGKSLRQRSRALIEIAHPAHREELERAAYERFHTLHT